MPLLKNTKVVIVWDQLMNIDDIDYLIMNTNFMMRVLIISLLLGILT